MSAQGADTPYDELVWHFDRVPWNAGGPRWKAYLGDWTLIAYERGEWMVTQADGPDGYEPPRAGHMETGLDRAKRRSFLAYTALTQEIA